MTELDATSDATGVLGDPTVVVNDLHVTYRVYQEQRLALHDLLRRGMRSRTASEVHAVRGVSFTIRRGEAVGIVGSNGSGKSTLLRTIPGHGPIRETPASHDPKR